MAGAGFRSWVDEEPLYAADVVSYLMEQSVMVFADATARDLALPTPTEGMVVYTKDDNVIRYFDGTLWNAIGEITGGSGISVSESTSSFTISLNVDAKGDLLVGTANDTVSRIPVGSDGQVLTAASAETAGVVWQDGFTYASPLTTQSKTASYTVSSADAGKLAWIDTSAGDVTITLPDGATDTGLEDGHQFMFLSITSANDTIFQGNGTSQVVSKNAFLTMKGAYHAVTAIFYSALDTWILVGDLG